MCYMSVKGWFDEGDEDILRPYIQALKPKDLLVEIGTYYGKSTLFFRETNPEIRILTIDICNEKGIYEGYNVEVAERIDQEVLDQGNIFQVIGDSHDVIKLFNWGIDLLFIDSLHTYEDTYADLVVWGTHVVSGGTIICHDHVSTFSGVIKAVKRYADSHNDIKVVDDGSIAILKKC